MTSLMLMLGTLAVVAALGLTFAAYLGHVANEAEKAQREATKTRAQAGAAAAERP